MIRQVLRRAWRAPGFVLPVLALVAIAVAGNAATFSALYAMAWQPLPYRDGDRLVELRLDLRDIGLHVGLSPTLQQALAKDAATFAGLVGWQAARPLDDAAGRAWKVQRVTPDFGAVLGVDARLGRALAPTDATGDVARTMVISHATWQSRFGGADDVLGRAVRLGRDEYTVVGVMPRGFAFPDAGVDAWLPFVPTAIEREQDAAGGFGLYHVGARLAPGITLTQVRESLAAVLAHEPALAGLRGAGANFAGDVRAWRDRYGREHLRGVVMLQGAALLLLAVIAANLANLVAMRVLARRREFAICRAVGAGRRDLARAMLFDLAVPSVVGLVLGLALAPVVGSVLRALALVPATMPGADAPSLAGPLVAVIAMIVAIGAALAIAWPRVARDAGTAAIDTRTIAAPSGRLRGALLVGQVAVTTLVVGLVALLGRSVVTLAGVERGFDARGVVLTTIDRQHEADAGETAPALIARLRERLAALPGVTDVGIADATPFGSSHFLAKVVPPDGGAPIAVRSSGVDAGYFAAMGMRLVRGGSFSASSSPNSADIVVDTTFSRQWFGDADPIGRTVRIADDEGALRDARIVGVVPAVKQQSLDEAADQAAIYRFVAEPSPVFFVVTRTAGDPAALTDAIRAVALAASPDAVVAFNAPLADAVAASMGPRVAVLRLAAAFALATLIVAACGLYAVLSLRVRSRRAEIGVRLALGADRSRIIGLVLGEGGRPIALGVAIGIAGGVVAARAIADQLFRVSPVDMGAWSLAGVAIAIVALVASALPAWRASRVLPREALASD